MRVLHIIPSVSLKHGGPSYAIRAYARALLQADIKITVATTDDDGPHSRLNVRHGVEEFEDGVPFIYSRRNLVPYKVSYGLGRWLRANTKRFDVVHLHALFSFSSTVGARAARRAGIPYVVRPLGVLNRWGIQNRRSIAKRLSLRLFERRIVKRAAALHFTTSVEAEEAADVIPGLSEMRQAIIPVPVEAPKGKLLYDHGKPNGAIEKAPNVLYLSRIDRKKNLELLLDAFALVLGQMPEASLTVAGTGEEAYVAALQTRARRLGIDRAVSWTGYLQGEAKECAFAEAGLFVLVSASENFGIAPVEAMAAGVPILISTEVAVSGKVKEYRAGEVVSLDAAEVASVICRLLSDQTLSATLARNAQRLVQQEYSPERIGQQLRELYQTVSRVKVP